MKYDRQILGRCGGRNRVASIVRIEIPPAQHHWQALY
jgi:hypothetical protein